MPVVCDIKRHRTAIMPIVGTKLLQSFVTSMSILNPPCLAHSLLGNGLVQYETYSTRSCSSYSTCVILGIPVQLYLLSTHNFGTTVHCDAKSPTFYILRGLRLPVVVASEAHSVTAQRAPDLPLSSGWLTHPTLHVKSTMSHFSSRP